MFFFLVWDATNAKVSFFPKQALPNSFKLLSLHTVFKLICLSGKRFCDLSTLFNSARGAHRVRFTRETAHKSRRKLYHFKMTYSCLTTRIIWLKDAVDGPDVRVQWIGSHRQTGWGRRGSHFAALCHIFPVITGTAPFGISETLK